MQFLNASWLIVLTVDGIVTEVILLLLKNAPNPILVHLLGITNDVAFAPLDDNPVISLPTQVK